MKTKNILWITLLFFLFLVFRNWFSLTTISRGDLTNFFPDMMREFFGPPFAWETFRGAGLGGNGLVFQGAYFFNLPLSILSFLFNYNLVERLVWFFPILATGIIASYLLAWELKLFPEKFIPISIIIFILNTYFLMIIGGGQITVSLAYVMIPLTLALFIKSLKGSIKVNILFSLSLTLLIAWDYRFAYMFGGIILLYCLFFFKENLKLIKRLLLLSFVSLIIILGLHAFWLIPFFIRSYNPISSVPSVYTTLDAVKFFSFADFSHSLSLLQPNWPENIFGKTYFMRWEFLLLPILAFSSLLFLKNRHSGKERSDDSGINNGFWTSQNDEKRASNMIHFFVLLGLVGAFLAKGSNPPFGDVYLWLFNHVPGMIMFRDPTKFYIYVVLSYSILIPFTVAKVYEKLSEKSIIQNQKYWPSIFLLLVTVYLFLLVRPAIFGELGGTLKPRDIPEDYIHLKNFIADQPEFFRTFWIPQKQRFAYYTNNHPAIDANEFFMVSSLADNITLLKKPETGQRLSLSGVKYIILPFDSEKEIFLKDRQYDDKQRQAIEKELDQIPWLRKVDPKKIPSSLITVYQTQTYHPHFWLETYESGQLTKIINVENQIVNPTKYKVFIDNLPSSSRLVFSENYSPDWVATINNQTIKSTKTYTYFNGFNFDLSGNFQVIIEYHPQKFVYLGSVVSLLTILICGSLLITGMKIFRRVH